MEENLVATLSFYLGNIAGTLHNDSLSDSEKLQAVEEIIVRCCNKVMIESQDDQ